MNKTTCSNLERVNSVELSLTHANLEVTGGCNQKCVYCFNDSGALRQSSDLQYTSWVNLVSRLTSYGLKSILITGGEPFLWPEIIPFIEFSLELGLKTSVLSNGLNIPKLVFQHRGTLNRLELAQISLDSMNQEVHDKRRRYRGAWNSAIKAIDALKSINVPIEISCTVSNENLFDCAAVGEYANSIGATLLLRPLVGLGRARNYSKPVAFMEQFESVISKLKESEVTVVNDRFFYAPVEKDIDVAAQEKGILTFESNGEIRCGSVILPGGQKVTNAFDFARVA